MALKLENLRSTVEPLLLAVDLNEHGNAYRAQEIRAEIARERREAVKARDLDRRTKRQNKRSQCY